MNYKDILKDKVIQEQLISIDSSLKDNDISHGYKHTLNVINIASLIGKQLLTKEEINLLLIAIVFHDLGFNKGKEGHEHRSSIIAKEYLQNKLSEEEITKICDAIELHHNKNNVDNLTLYEHILLISDKLDFTYKRLYKHQFNKGYMQENIKDLNVKIDKSCLTITITFNKKITKEEFTNWFYYKKVKKRMEEFAIKLNKELIIKYKGVKK